jgi:hypothetical protein
MNLERGRELTGRRSPVLKGPRTKMTHSANMAKTGILGVGRDMSIVLGVSLKRPRAPGSLQ